MFDSVQKRVYFSGIVQGVGFRFSTRRVAERFEVTGTVKNLPDGRVELIAEGPADEIDRFVETIEDQMQGCITDMTVESAPGTGRFPDFRIAY